MKSITEVELTVVDENLKEIDNLRIKRNRRGDEYYDEISNFLGKNEIDGLRICISVQDKKRSPIIFEELVKAAQDLGANVELSHLTDLAREENNELKYVVVRYV